MEQKNNVNLEDINLSEYNERNKSDIDNKHEINREEIKKKERDDKINIQILENDKRDIARLEINNISDNDINIVEERFQVPPHLKKTFIFSMILAAMGLTLFILGFIQDVATADPGKGVTFWVLGGVVMIPGGFYSYQFWRARRTRDLDLRDEILEDIPEL